MAKGLIGGSWGREIPEKRQTRTPPPYPTQIVEGDRLRFNGCLLLCTITRSKQISTIVFPRPDFLQHNRSLDLVHCGKYHSILLVNTIPSTDTYAHQNYGIWLLAVCSKAEHVYVCTGCTDLYIRSNQSDNHCLKKRSMRSTHSNCMLFWLG